MPSRFISITLVLVVALAVGGTPASPQSGKAAMLLPGSINDQSWNAQGHAGMLKLKDMGMEIAYSENVAPADHIEAMKDYARRGFSPVIGHSGRFLSAAQRVGPEFEKTIFIVGSGSGAFGKNVNSIDFDNTQFGYLLGVLAARMSKTGKVGSVNSLEGLPNVVAQVGGFRQGFKSVRPDGEVKVIFHALDVDDLHLTVGANALEALAEPAHLRDHVGQPFQTVHRTDFSGLAHAGGQHAEQVAELRVVEVDRVHVLSERPGAGADDEDGLFELGPDALGRREESSGVADDGAEAAPRVILHRLDVVGRRDVLGVGDLHAHVLELQHPGVALGVPALVVDTAGQQHRRLAALRRRRRPTDSESDHEHERNADEAAGHGGLLSLTGPVGAPPEYSRRLIMSTRSPRPGGARRRAPGRNAVCFVPTAALKQSSTRGDHMAQLKIPLDTQRFEKGMRWKDYMAQMGDTRARTEDNYAKSKLTDDERKFFSGVNQVRFVLMLAENWCGDVHRNSPLVAHICEAMPGADLRVFLRDQNVDLRDTFLNNGYQSIPVVVFFDKDWNEIGRWLERAHAATAKVVGIRAKTVDVAPKDTQEAAMAEYRKQVQVEYDAPGGPLWRAAAPEVRLPLAHRPGAAAPYVGAAAPA